MLINIHFGYRHRFIQQHQFGFFAEEFICFRKSKIIVHASGIHMMSPRVKIYEFAVFIKYFTKFLQS